MAQVCCILSCRCLSEVGAEIAWKPDVEVFVHLRHHKCKNIPNLTRKTTCNTAMTLTTLDKVYSIFFDHIFP